MNVKFCFCLGASDGFLAYLSICEVIIKPSFNLANRIFLFVVKLLTCDPGCLNYQLCQYGGTSPRFSQIHQSLQT
jgi:hypothetical protein